jgi:hypothetical protein
MNLLQRLKIETAFAHDRAEEAFDLQTRTRSLRAYRDLLAQLCLASRYCLAGRAPI